MKSPLIYLVAGEPSGDALGAGLMRGLRVDLPDIRFAGIGGAAMQKEGLESLFPYNELAIMGFAEVVPHIPKLLKRIKQTHADITEKRPAAVITIDSPGFNFRLASALQEAKATRTIKRIHYVAPSVWAYKPKRAIKTAKLFDLLLTLLPFEPPYFERQGLHSVFTGHPVIWQNLHGDAEAFRAKYNIPANADILLILPGSRPGEVKMHLDIFMQAAKTLGSYVPVILAGSLVRETIRSLTPEGTIIADINEKQDAFAAASLALSKSGTITLELAVAGVPMVVSHKVNALSAWLVRRMIQIPYASLVNIAAKAEIVPELIQERCNVQEISSHLLQLASTEARNAQRAACGEAIRILKGDNTASPNMLAAQEVVKCIGWRKI